MDVVVVTNKTSTTEGTVNIWVNGVKYVISLTFSADSNLPSIGYVGGTGSWICRGVAYGSAPITLTKTVDWYGAACQKTLENWKAGGTGVHPSLWYNI
jgi:hypothetical protein